MTCRVADRLPVALRGVGEAVRLDSKTRMTEAYVKYMACVIYIGQALIDDAARRDLWELSLPETMRFFKMASQCLERAAAVVESSLRHCDAEKEQPASPDITVDVDGQILGDEPEPTEQNWADVPPLSAIRSVGEQSGHCSPIGDNERDGSMSPLEHVPNVESISHIYSASPDGRQLAEALHKNEQLMRAYQTRMKKIADNRGGASKAHLQVNFMLMRDCQENIAIARSRQDALLQKMKLRQQRDAADGSKSPTSVVPTGIGEEIVLDRERLCADIEHFEETQAWSKELRTKIFSHPEETLYINDFIIKALSTGNHPLSSLLGQFQYDIYQRLLPLSNQHNRSIEVDLQAINNKRAKTIAIPKTPTSPQHRAASVSTSWPHHGNPSRHLTGRDHDHDSTDGIASTGVGGASSAAAAEAAQLRHSVSSTPPSRSSSPPHTQHRGHRRNVSSGGRLENVVPDLNNLVLPPTSRRRQKVSLLKKPTQLHPLMNSESPSDVEEDVSDEDTFPVVSPQQLLARSLTTAKQSTTLPPPSAERVRGLFSSWCTPEELEAAESTHIQLQCVTTLIHSYIDQLEGCFMRAYPEMSTPAGRDQCRASIELRFFPPLWSLLLAAFREANYPQEKTLAGSMTTNYCLSTKEMQIQEKFSLTDQAEADAQPYLMAVEQLQRITKLYCPLEKLECVVNVSRSICECVEEYWRHKRGRQVAAKYATIGCDDLLPILGYVVVRSALPQLVSECCAMEEFIHEGYLMGEEGYCLTTLQTALTYVTCLAGEKPPVRKPSQSAASLLR
eukprot:scpid30083/ scgid30994/ Uncharacterized protein C16orf7 homolog; 5-day ovary-specific transcript 1 protein